MPEHRVVRQVLLNCVKPTQEKLLADSPGANLSIENATKMSKDRKLWSKNRPSLRCPPLSGGVAIKKVSNGSLQKFEMRQGLRSRKSHGESGSADEEAIAREFPVIQAYHGNFL